MKLETHSLSIKKNRSTTVKSMAPDAGNIKSGVILAHGLNNDLDLPLLVRVAETLAAGGRATARFNFLYREEGKEVADSKEDLETCLVEVYEDIQDRWDLPADRIVLAGKSLGARVNAVAVRDGLHVAALIHLGFPLFAPSRPDKSREDLILAVDPMPQLFFAGTRDALCPLKPLKAALDRLTGPRRLHVIEGGDHSFHLPGPDPRAEDEILNDIAKVAANWLEELGL